MPATRIVPIFESRGLLAFAAAVGLACGAVFVPLSEWGERVASRNGWSMMTFVGLSIAAMLLPGILLVFFAVRRTRRRRPILSAALVLALCQLSAAYVVATLKGPDAGAVRSSFWGDVENLAIAGGVAAAVAVLVMLLTRWLALLTIAPVEQTGRFCWRCGYDLGAPTLPMCPECAEPADFARFRAPLSHALWRVLCRSGRPVLIAVVLALGAWSAYRITSYRLPSQRFAASMSIIPANALNWLYADPHAPFGGRWDGLLATRKIPGEALKHLGTAYWPRGPRNGPAWVRMRVFICEAPGSFSVPAVSITGASVPMSVPMAPSEGSVRICADLNSDQADRVIQAGSVPQSLIDALLAAAAEHGWKPGPPGSMGPSFGTEQVAVDPELHFRHPSAPDPVTAQDPAQR